jgi:hypothetical protein
VEKDGKQVRVTKMNITDGNNWFTRTSTKTVPSAEILGSKDKGYTAGVPIANKHGDLIIPVGKALGPQTVIDALKAQYGAEMTVLDSFPARLTRTPPGTPATPQAKKRQKTGGSAKKK